MPANNPCIQKKNPFFSVYLENSKLISMTSMMVRNYASGKPAYLVPVPSQDKVPGLWQEGHSA